MARTTPVNEGYSIILGTTSGTNGGTTDTWIEWKVTSQSVANNTSTIRAILYSQNTAGKTSSYDGTAQYGWVSYDNGTKQWLTIDGYDYANQHINKFADHTWTITHNSDGTKTISLQGQFTTRSSWITGGSVNGNVTLPRIARASTISSLSTNLGSAGTISITRQSSDFTHTLTYTFGSASGTIVTKTSNTSVSWTPDVSLIAQFGADDKTKTGTITCTTYSGNTSVGTSTGTLTLTIPNSSLGNVSGTFGSALTLTATNACSSGLTYTFAYHNGSSWQSIASTSNKTQSWTPNTSLIANVSNASSGSVSVRVITYRGSTAINTATATATLTIPKNTSSAVSGTIGSALSIPITKPYSGLTSTITYSFGSASGTIATTTSSISQSWTPPTSLLTQIPNSTSGTGSITITTYNGTAPCGSNSYALTLSAANSVVPTSSLSLTRINNNSTVNGWGIYLQGYSQVQATLTGSGVSGSTIKSMSISGTGLSSSSSYSTSSATLTGTSSVLTTSGTLTYKGNVSDSRNRSATEKSQSITVVAYSQPSVSGVSLARSNSSGTIDTSGTYLKVAFTLNYSSASGHNSASVSLRYKESSASSWTTYGAVTNGANLNLNLDVSKNYQAQLLVSDALNSNIASAIVTIPSSERVLNVNGNGSGLAIGGFSTMEGVFQEYYPARFGDDVYVTNGLPIKISDYLPLLTNGAFSTSSATNDADTMTEVGSYWVGCAYVNNMPFTSSFGILTTDKGSVSPLCYIQTFVQYSTYRVFKRMYANSRWYPWREITDGARDFSTRVTDYNYETAKEFVDCLYTYLNNRSSLTYNNRTAINVTMYSSGNVKGIDCSTFVLLGLKGVTYADSRYVNGGDRDSNYPTYLWGMDIYSGKYKTVSSVEEYCRYATDMARWFYNTGRIYLHDDTWSNVKYGDIMFWVDASDVDNEDINATIAGVHHVAVFTGINSSGNVSYIDANTGRTNVIQANAVAPTSSALSQVMYCGALPLETSATQGTEHTIYQGAIKKFDSRQTSANLTRSADGAMSHYLATSIMSEGKPPYDSHIIQMNWDNTSGGDSQIAVRNNNPLGMWIRTNAAGDFADKWYSVFNQIDDNNTIPVEGTSLQLGNLGSGMAWYNRNTYTGSATLPSEYGILVFFGCGTDWWEMWHTQPNGNVYVRGGNTSNPPSSVAWKVMYGSYDWTTTTEGLTINAHRRGQTCRVYVSGTPTSAVTTSGAYYNLTTLPELCRPSMAPVNFSVYNATTCGQFNITTAGVVRLGYTKDFSGNNKSLSGNIYLTQTYECSI